MSEMRDWNDQQLLREHVGRGSEDAFAVLVQRHVSLVFGAACRRLGNPSGAEEVTQAVFIVLARKAPFLCHHQNLSGWLHRTTILECQQQLRTDLRRRRREDSAMQMNELTAPDATTIRAELDEALLNLSEKDRQPLLLRFFESMSLRQVAGALGIREDAAQKRVAKSLTLLERILCKRGRDIGSAALAILLAESAHAAPIGLAASATQGAMASGGAAGLGAVLFGKIMALTKIQTTGVCALLVAAPLLLQTQGLLNAKAERTQLESALAQAEARSRTSLETVTRLRTGLAQFQSERPTLLASPRAPQSNSTIGPASVAKLYQWDNHASFVRLPKSLLEKVRLTARQEVKERPKNEASDEIHRQETLGPKGELSDALVEALALSDVEKSAVGNTLSNFAAQFEAIASQHAMFTNTMPPGISFTPVDGKLYTLVTREFPAEGLELKNQLIGELQNVIGPERSDALMTQGKSSFDHYFLNFGARQQWIAVGRADDGMITVGRVTLDDNGNSLGGSVNTTSTDNLPQELRSYVPDTFFKKHE